VKDKIDRPLLSGGSAAEVAGLSRSAMYGLLKAGVIPGVIRLPGRETLIRRASLLDWLTGDSQGVASAR
jgi:predicted DNA-binding transcriptional regulator AlpA